MTQTQETKIKKTRRPRTFVLGPEKEGILLNLSLNKKECGMTLTHIIDWHPQKDFDGELHDYENKILIYEYKNRRFAYIKVRKLFINGHYGHWTTEKAMPVSLERLEEMLKSAGVAI